jgi:acetate kinase
LEVLVDEEIGVIKELTEIEAVGHRIVQGGDLFSGPEIVTNEVIDKIEGLAAFAPLHNKAHAIGLRAVKAVLPDVPMVVVFDTTFHQTIPEYAHMYALPYHMYKEGKIRKYGFHGTSNHYVSLRAAELMGKNVEDLNIIVCHLGNGSSITAIKNGKSFDTTMGFTPLEGLIMGSRVGSCDPAVVSYIAEKYSISNEEMSDFLNKECGFLGVSGVSSDYRDVVKASETNDRAKLTLDMFYYQIKKHIGEYFAVLGKLDAIVFTAGIGENSIQLRECVTENLEHMGISVDHEKNLNANRKECEISSDDSKVKVFVIPTNEELMIAKETFRIVKSK